MREVTWKTIVMLWLIVVLVTNIGGSVALAQTRQIRPCWESYEQYLNESASQFSSCMGEFVYASSRSWYQDIVTNPFRTLGCEIGFFGRSVSAGFQYVSCSTIPTR
jgi:hypothetical protein